MATDVRCPVCHAPIPFPRPAACAYCGTALPSDDGERPAAPEADLTEARLAAVRHSPEFPHLLTHTPAAGGLSAGVIVVVCFGVVFVGACIVMATFAASFAPLPFVLMPLAMGLFAVVAFATAVRKGMRRVRAPWKRVPAVVIDERTAMSGGGESSSVRTTYYALLELEDGQRLEVETPAAVAGKIAAGDAGVAYLRGDYLADFRRV